MMSPPNGFEGDVRLPIALVMELVEGEDLSAHIRARPSMTLDQYDVTRDGQRFLFIQPYMDPNATPAPPAPITVVVNRMAGIRK